MFEYRLKVGILLDSFILPAWAYASLERVVNLDCANVSVIILNDKEDSLKYKPDLFYKNIQNLAYRLLSKIDKAIFQRGPDAFVSKDARELFINVPVIRVKPGSAGQIGFFDPADIVEIKSYQLDILIQMGFEALIGEILTAARFGVWTYDSGTRSDPPGFWEVAHYNPETSWALFVLNNTSTHRKTLYRSWVQTYPYSPARNRNRAFWIFSSFLPRQVELLYRLGEKDFFAEIKKYNLELDYSYHSQDSPPSNFLVLRIYIKLLFRFIHEIIQRALYLEHWHLLYDVNSSFLPSNFSNFKEINPPKDQFWADPHIISDDSKHYIFVEEYIYKERKGQISVIEMEQNGAYRESVQVLSKEHHLSYPFVFEWNDKYYMVPETSINRTVELYECTRFPHEWKFRMNLMENVNAVDTTLFYDQEKWWLFTGITENEGAFPLVELFLFYSKELFSKDWYSHPLNPIISDVKKNRPAGKLFRKNGKIYRPSQDNSKRYGWGFDINEILILSETSYLEESAVKIRPDWNEKIEGVHTFSQSGSLTVIDAGEKTRKYFSDFHN